VTTGEVAAKLSEWCQRWLDSPVEQVLIETGFAVRVFGVRLSDGREVVIKARRFTPRLVGAASVQHHMWTAGFPCPQPLAGPTEFGGAWISAETRVMGGGAPLVDDPEAPELHAAALAEFIRLAAHCEIVPTLVPPPDFAHWNHTETGHWPRRDRGDPDLNREPDPIWLSTIVDRVRSRLAMFKKTSVIGHADWWSENLHWVGHRLHVVHDWDSVTAQPEAILAGEAAYLFAATTFELDGEAPGATVEETERFLVAFEQARGRPWSADERQAAWAAGLWVAAFHARLARFEDSGEGFADLVRQDAPERLRRAGA
jgi:hypothetical protein